MAQQSPAEIIDSSSSSNDQSQSCSDPSLSRNVSFSRLNAQAPEFVPIRSSSTQSKQQQQQQQLQQPRVVMPAPPPPPGAMIHHVYSPHGPHPPTSFQNHVVPLQNHVIPVHHQIHHHVPAQTYHSHRNHHHHHNSNSNHHRHNQLEDHQDEVEVTVRDQKDKKDHLHGGLSDESTQKILNQVEYYFSDLNLATTDHLMRFIQKDPDGYVPITVVASFKKIKAVVSNNSQLASVLRNSSKLVVSEDGKKVKRQHPLTESEMEELQSRIVIAENLPEDHCHQNLMKIFSVVGSVKTIRTCLPQTPGGGVSSTSRSTKAADSMLFSNKLHAFVEYESVELAEKAITELNDEGNWRSGLRVRLMLKRASKTANARGKKGHDGEWHHEEEDASTSEQQVNEKQLEEPSQQHDVPSHEHNMGEEHVNDKEGGGQRKGRNKGRGKGRGRGVRGQFHHNERNGQFHFNDRGHFHHNSRGHHVGMPLSSNVVSNAQPIIGKQPAGPRNPDGTRGFAIGRGKAVAVNTA